MNLRLESGEIALPKDFRFDITANHPFFSNDGSASTPATIPSTPSNRKLLGSPEIHNAAKRYSRHLSAVLSHGIYSKRCRMVIDAASKTGGITASLALEESEMYAEYQDKKLKEIITPGIQQYGTAIGTFLTALYTTPNSDIVFLKVAADAEDTDGADATGSTRAATVVLNQTTASGGTTMKTSGYTIKRDNGNGGQSTISLPALYGLTPFLKLHALIRKTFQALGYTVAENIFATDSDLARIVVLHQTADSMVNLIARFQNPIYFLRIPYDDMVPSMTVGELIEWLRDKFGAFVTVKNTEVRIRLMRDILAASSDLDLSGYVRDEVTVTHPDPVMLRTGCQHDIESSEPAAETLEALRAAYPSLVTCYNVSEAEGVGLFHVMPLGKFYFRNSADDGLVKVGTDGFDCYREMRVDTEEITTDDSLVPMILHNGEYMPYIGETIRRHIDIDDKDADAEQKMMICYCKYDGTRNFGTLYNFAPDGTEHNLTTPDLIPEGLMTEYWDGYRRLRLDGAPTIQAKLDIPLHLLVSMDLCTPKILLGAKVLIQSVKYSISESGISTCEFTFFRIQNAVDGESITNPTFASNLIWEYVNTRKIFTSGNVTGRHPNGILVTELDGLDDYTAADAPDYTPSHPGIIEKRRSRWLKYTRYVHESGGWFLWYWSSDSSYTCSETYEEYFISRNR